MKTETNLRKSLTCGRRIVRTAIMACLAILAGCSSKAGTPAAQASTTPHDVTLTAQQRQHVRLFTVAESTFHESIDATGVVAFDNDQATSVLAPFSGPVTKLLVEQGAKVKKGQALAVVDSPDFTSAIANYRKALVTARTARRVAELDQDLVKHHGVSQREAEQALTDATSAEADRDAARQALVALDAPKPVLQDIEEGKPISHITGTIRAPVSGTLAEKLITPGQLLQTGSTPCFTVANLSRMWVMAQVFGSDAAKVHVGDTAEVESDDGTLELNGKVGNVADLVDPDTRAVTVRVVVDNPQRQLKKQMYVRVRIQSQQQRSGLLVPVSAILRDDDNLPFVYVAGNNNGFARRHVTLGYRDGDLYAISEGLRAGEKLVIDGGIFVQFMQNQ